MLLLIIFTIGEMLVLSEMFRELTHAERGCVSWFRADAERRTLSLGAVHISGQSCAWCLMRIFYIVEVSRTARFLESKKQKQQVA